MRRTFTAILGLVAAATVAGCEDGPNQTFTPEPAGAGNVINGPGGGALTTSDGGGAYTGHGKQSFDASTGGTNANMICTASQVQAARQKCFSAPISPPGLAACLDIAGGPKANGGSGWAPGDDPATYYQPATETWTGATVEQAEAILCQAVPYMFFQGLNNSVAWGDQAEVGVLYNTSNRQITDLLLQTGYEGGLSATSVDGKTTYTVNLNNTPPTKTDTANGATTSVFLDWNSADGVTAINVFADALYDALRAKYSPTTPTDEGCGDPTPQCCVDNGHCIIGNNGTGGGYFYYTPLGLAIFVNTTVGSAQANSTFTLFDQQIVKTLPFSNSATLLKLDSTGIGPVALSTAELGTNTTCNYTLGMKFSDFDKDCVEIFPTNTDAGITNNLIEKKKLFGALNHTDETFIFNVVGVDPNFSATLGPAQVVADLSDDAGIPVLVPGEVQEPGDNDTAYSLNIDQNYLGVIANDFANNDATQAQDWHGIGLVTLETAYLVQKYMTAGYGVNTNLGDPDCLANPSKPGHGKVCSGLEGIVTSAPPASVVGLPGTMAVNAIGAAAAMSTCSSALNDAGACPDANVVPAVDTNIAVGLKPSTWYADVCYDAGGLSAAGTPIGYGNCLSTYYFTVFQDAVAASFPQGTPVPAALADRRFFFQQWILAFIKYMHVAANPNATLAMVDAAESVSDDIYFDSQGGGFESGAYVDRTSVNSLGQAPTVLTIGTNLTTSVLNNIDFTRFNTRGENLLYTALTTTPGDKPGAEAQYVSNIVGSPVLQAVYGSYACATNTVAVTDNCPCTSGVVAGNVVPVTTDAGAPDSGDAGNTIVNCPVAPLDVFGNPLYAAYAPAFGHSFLNIAANGSAPSASAMTVTTSAQTDLIQSAVVNIPVWSNPFDPTTAKSSDKIISALIPYLPQGANVGFPVTIDGSRDKFYNTFNVDFSGATGDGAGGSISASVDYEILDLPSGGDGGTAPGVVVRALETTSYLGLVFVCNEGTDVLAVRMYDNSDEIFAFLAAHPDISATQQGAQSDCNIQIKYSVYGNYPDYISSLTNGVRLGFTPGFGGSVVTDVTLFDPNVVASLGN